MSSRAGRSIYYWDDYEGPIPANAIQAGVSSSGQAVYIGKAKVDDLGQFPVSIYEGELQVHVPYYRYRNVTSKKILCGPADKFRWVSTNSRMVAALVRAKKEGYEPVIGGQHNNKTEFYIGRVKHAGAHYIGKICISELDSGALLWYRRVDQSEEPEQHTDKYELLQYRE